MKTKINLRNIYFIVTLFLICISTATLTSCRTNKPIIESGTVKSDTLSSKKSKINIFFRIAIFGIADKDGTIINPDYDIDSNMEYDYEEYYDQRD